MLAASSIAGDTAEKVDLKLAGQLIGLAHDFGKYSEAFQTYIQSVEGLLDPDQDEEWVDADHLKGKIDHSSAGAQWIWQALSLPNEPKTSEEKARQLTAQMLALAVASHHGGLIDCVAADIQQAGQDRFMRRIKKDDKKTHLAEVRTRLDDDVRRLLQELLDSEELITSVRLLRQRIVQTEKQHQGNKDIQQFKLGMTARFLLSCLVEGDHRNSGEFEHPETTQVHKEKKPDWAVLIHLLEEKLKSFTNEPNPLEIDAIRADISAHCLAAATRDQGIYTLTVPTGGGKTLASLRFALHHAQKHQLDRIIYVIPFTSIIDQNAKEVREILEPEGTALGSVLLEHHSNLLPEKFNWQHKLLSENWNVPIIYTTSVQLLEALFGGGTRNARRMHALARSVLIFDEIQALPLRCAHLFANALNFLAEHAKSSVVLCTATQPLLHEIDPQRGAVRLAPKPELMPDVGKLFADLKRTNIINHCRPGGWLYEAAAELTIDTQREFRSTLVIVNTKQAARELFMRCCDRTDAPVYHLSTGMCPAHRRDVLEKIKIKLGKPGQPGKPEPVICISTQLIEAGVNVSFGSVIRSLAGMDSIAQAAGRCNRHGEQATPAPVFVINLVEEKIDLLREIVAGQEASKRLFCAFSKDPTAFQNDVFAYQAMCRYFNYYFHSREKFMGYPVRFDRMSYAEKNADATLLSLLSGNHQAVNEYKNNHSQAPIYPLHQSFHMVTKAFKAIDSPTQSIVVPHGEAGKNIIADLNSELYPNQLNKVLRQAQQFSVNLFEHDIEKLHEKRALYQTPLGVWCLRSEHYWPDIGVSHEPRELTEEEKGEFFQ
ncbi:MAG: CRISPR-associated helicase Cas3' [Proteobacteria bacterium]|nr:CRISPR-associated helicase Cas3' [Pseudomonadota bacterium]MCL2306913.1 CRISPR-associated helicase Cas3' [Pseudomonadota bacterium]